MPSPHYHHNIPRTPIHGALEHHAYYPAPPNRNETLRFVPYYGILPKTEPHSTFHIEHRSPLIFNQGDDGTWYCKRTPKTMRPKLPMPNTTKFAQHVNEYATKKWRSIVSAFPSQLYSSTQTTKQSGTYKPKSLPSGLLNKLSPLIKNTTAPWYHFQKNNSLSDLKNRGGIGDKRANAIKYPGKYGPYNIKATAFSTVWCPNCTTEFQAPYYSDMEEEIDYLSYIVYCPECGHQDIPTTHIDEPIQPKL